MRLEASQQASTHIKVETIECQCVGCAPPEGPLGPQTTPRPQRAPPGRPPYSAKVFELPEPPLIGRDRHTLKHVPAIFNVALGVAGDPWRAAASASDLTARSAWFKSLVLTKVEDEGQCSLLEVTVPCQVPFEVVEAAVEAIYSGRVYLTWGPGGAGNLLDMTLLADALQVGRWPRAALS